MTKNAKKKKSNKNKINIPKTSLIYNSNNKNKSDHEKQKKKRVLSNVEPGYLRSLLPEQLPDEPEKFSDILKDVEKFIMPGVTHWSSPRFHAFYPTGNSYPAILADMLTGGIGCIGFTWMSSPSCTELEVIMMNWLGELIGLPKEFLSKNGTNGEESHTAVFRAAVLGGVNYRSVPSDENDSLRGNNLKKYIEEDIEKGLIPFFVSKKKEDKLV
ncbi:hypothetical protein Avbf_07880 [Armadillidium vulgare]|nr:hypothetical protein Avbf_07880 [Armadillidium vulgare]